MITNESAVQLNTARGLIKGSLMVPENKQNIPVVLIIQGSGPIDRNGNGPGMKNNSLKMLAHDLKKCGIASLRFDKFGIGESTNTHIKEEDISFSGYVEDVKKWINFLIQDNRFSKIIVAGHSEGSLIGMVACLDEKADKFISISGAGLPADQILAAQIKNKFPQLYKSSKIIMSKLKQGKKVKDLEPGLNQLFRESIQNYFISWFQYDPQKEIAKLNIPCLIIHGTSDIQVSENNADYLFQANINSQKIIISKMNHILKKSLHDIEKNILTYNNPDLPLHPKLINAVSEFIFFTE